MRPPARSPAGAGAAVARRRRAVGACGLALSFVIGASATAQAQDGGAGSGRPDAAGEAGARSPDPDADAGGTPDAEGGAPAPGEGATGPAGAAHDGGAPRAAGPASAPTAAAEAEPSAAGAAAGRGEAAEGARALGAPVAPAPPAGPARARTGAAAAARAAPEPGDLPTPPARFGGRAYVARYALRPLTLGEGVLRIDNGSAGRLGGPAGFGIGVSLALGLSLGVTDDFQIGVSETFASTARVPVRDPVIAAAGRFFHDDVVELGLHGSVRFPVVTTGDTVARLGVPIVVHGGRWFRLAAALDVELLFATNVSPLLAVPVQVAFSVHETVSLGLEGWVGVLDGADAVGAVGAFFQHTGRTPVRALWDVRIAGGYLVAERAGQISTAVSFYPQLW